MLQAVRLKRELKKLPGVTVKTRMGSVGQMDVIGDGKLLFSYQTEGRMPSLPELVSRVRAG